MTRGPAGIMPAGLFSQAIVHFADRGLPSFFITVPNPILTIIHKENNRTWG